MQPTTQIKELNGTIYLSAAHRKVEGLEPFLKPLSRQQMPPAKISIMMKIDIKEQADEK